MSSKDILYYHRLANKSFKEHETKCLDSDDIAENMDIGIQYGMYTLESSLYIQKYTEILERPIKVSMTTGKRSGTKEERELFKSYLTMLDTYKKFLNFEIPSLEKVDETQELCNNCSSSSFVHTDDSDICTECGTEVFDLCTYSSFKDNDRVHITAKHVQDRTKSIEEDIRKFQGKGVYKVTPEVITQIEDELENVHHIKKTSKQFTPRTVRMILKKLSKSQYYKDANFIWMQISNRKLPDISDIEALLIKEFRQLENAYSNFTTEQKNGRTSFPRREYVFRRQLERHGKQFADCFFSEIKSDSTERHLKTVCNELFRSLGWSIS